MRKNWLKNKDLIDLNIGEWLKYDEEGDFAVKIRCKVKHILLNVFRQYGSVSNKIIHQYITFLDFSFARLLPVNFGANMERNLRKPS